MDGVKIIAEELLKKEVLFKDDMERLLGKRPYEDNSPVEDDEVSIPENDTTSIA
jgi:cell division protease FtsH